MWRVCMQISRKYWGISPAATAMMQNYHQGLQWTLSRVTKWLNIYNLILNLYYDHCLLLISQHFVHYTYIIYIYTVEFRRIWFDYCVHCMYLIVYDMWITKVCLCNMPHAHWLIMGYYISCWYNNGKDCTCNDNIHYFHCLFPGWPEDSKSYRYMYTCTYVHSLSCCIYHVCSHVSILYMKENHKNWFGTLCCPRRKLFVQFKPSMSYLCKECT